MGFTRDHRPIVGPIDALLTADERAASGLEGRVSLCAGFTGHGMSLGYETARLAVQGIASDEASVPEPLHIHRFKGMNDTHATPIPSSHAG